MNRKKLVFDMDGTLLDSMAMWNNFLDLYKKSEIIPQKSDYSPIIKNPSSISYSVDLVKKILKETMPDKMIASKIHTLLYDFYSSQNRAKNNVERIIKDLHSQGFEMYLGTATDHAYASQGIKSARLFEYFSKLYTPDVLGIKKNSIDYYLAIAEDLKTDPKDLVFFDDAAFAIEFAKNANYTTVGVFDHNSTEIEMVKKISDYFIHDFLEIPNILNKL